MIAERRGGVLALGVVLLLSAVANRAHSQGEKPSAAGPALKVGSLTLQRCRTPAPWCGTVVRALDPAGIVAGTLSVYFEYYPHQVPGKPLGMLVATEGGPGFPATESRDEYLDLLRPLRAHRDLLIMDNRGTGQSGAIDCRALQSAPAITVENVGACGRSLGANAALYSTGLAADDLAAILDALGAPAIDLYGDSYGTYFAQFFAVRHPTKLRSIILDGAYALDGPDYAWYPTYAPAMRAKFNLACSRDAACSRLSGNSLDHIAPALERLRRAPIEAQAHDADGRLQSFTADAPLLATVMFGGSPAYATVHELDAAARSFVAGDQAPLLRLMAETVVSVDSRDSTQSPPKFSAGLAAAVMCHDAPQIFDMALDPARRVADRDRAIAQRKITAPDTYAPFTIDEYRRMPLDYSFLDECVLWPAVPRQHSAASAPPYPDIPALIISGELDNMTTIADGAAAAGRFVHGRQLIVANSFHVNALPHARSGCAADLVRRFVRTLQLGDTRCAQAVPEVRLLPRFARHVSELMPARALTGNAAAPQQLQAVTAALLTAGDILARLGSNTTGEGVGLRGGTFSIKIRAHGDELVLRNVRWSEDLAVSGTLNWPGRSGRVVGELMLAGADELSGPLRVTWIEGTTKARAQVRGRLGKALVVAEMSAP